MFDTHKPEQSLVINNSSNIASWKGGTRNTSYCSVLDIVPGVSVSKSSQEAPACGRGERAGKPAETLRDKTIRWGSGSEEGVSAAFCPPSYSEVTQEENVKSMCKNKQAESFDGHLSYFGLEQYAKPLTSVLIWTFSPDLSRSSRMLLSTGPNYTSRPLAFSQISQQEAVAHKPVAM